MTVYVSDLFTATPAPVNATPASTRTWQWLRGSSAISGATSSTYTAVTADIGSTLSATQLETNFLATTTATSAATEVVQAFDPIRLFSASEPGVWYDPTDISTLYQNATGTIPVTSFGQPVGLMLDKSRGLVLGPELVVNGDFADGTTGWSPIDTTLSVVSAALRVTNTSTGSGNANQSWTTVVGRTYAVRFSALASSGANLDVRIGTSVASSANYRNNTTSAGTDYTAYFVATATTTVVTIVAFNSSATVGTFVAIDNVSVKELPGLHATQSTEASRPMYGIVPVSGRRNLLTQTEAFNEAVWTKVNSTFTSGTLTASAAFGKIQQNATVAAGSTCFIDVIKGTANLVEIDNGISGFNDVTIFNLETLTFTLRANNVSASIEAIGGGVIRLSVTRGAIVGNRISLAIQVAGETVLPVRAQLELGSTPTAYQRVSTDLDVTEAGVASVGYLRFDGSTSWMVTPTITPGTDKVQVFAGVRKNSDAAVGMLVELSVSGGSNNGTFFIAAPASVGPNYRFWSRGTLPATADPSGYAAPITNVLTGIGDISGDSAIFRVNGSEAAQSTTDQGTGDFLAYPLYIGRRGGTTVPFNGHIHSLIVRFGPTLTAARIAATEAWVATKTGGVTL